jgi:uncharacterized RDD family membrane protein YckC
MKTEAMKTEVLTPEGVPVPFTLASFSDRAAAFAIDVILQLIAIMGVVLLVMLGTSGGFPVAFALVFSFLVRSFYFTWFELRWIGRTPGKRRLKIRVVDRRGGPLTAEAIIARNFTRELEAWLPLAAVLAPEQLWPEAAGWARALASFWLLAIALLPLWNKQRLRVGDIVAGTMVVVEPRAILLEDQGQRGAARHRFTTAQLDVYGIYELQVLEDILRKTQLDVALEPGQLDVVADRIKTKIRWPRDAWRVEAEPFLRDFYAALRNRLEARMLLGKRKADKHTR